LQAELLLTNAKSMDNIDTHIFKIMLQVAIL